MTKGNVGFLHPDAMGVSLAASAQNSGFDAYWASEGRSRNTQERAARHDLRDVQTVEQLCEICQVIVCICPPHAAEAVAEQVSSHSFTGLYLDANAISPQRAERIGRLLTSAGATFVDGGIIGGPAWKPGQTWRYLSGEAPRGQRSTM